MLAAIEERIGPLLLRRLLCDASGCMLVERGHKVRGEDDVSQVKQAEQAERVKVDYEREPVFSRSVFGKNGRARSSVGGA